MAGQNYENLILSFYFRMILSCHDSVSFRYIGKSRATQEKGDSRQIRG
jgi:hypothetical protein